MTILYREATRDDLPSICALGEEVNALHHQAWPDVFAGPGTPERDSAMWAQGIGQDKLTTIVAEAQGRVVAFVMVGVVDESSTLFQPTRHARIASICVTARERGQGIGPALMARAERWAIAQGALDLRLNVWAFNRHALHVYAELGFVERSINLGKRLTPPGEPSSG